jgi:hypothetical protein
LNISFVAKSIINPYFVKVSAVKMQKKSSTF